MHQSTSFATLFSALILAVALPGYLPGHNHKPTIGEPAVSKVRARRMRRDHVHRRRIKVNFSYTGCPSGVEAPPSFSVKFEQEVLRLVNKERRRNGLSALRMDDNLARAARYHATDMARDNYFSHASKDRKDSGLVPACSTFERIRKFARYGHAENIAAGHSTPASVVRGWMKSPGHRRNILSSRSTLIGIGVAHRRGSQWRYYWVQNFGR